MRRLIILLVAVLALGCPVAANPFARTWHFAGHHKRFFLMEGAALTGAALHYEGLNDCRKRNGPEACDEHYGSAYGFYWFVTAVNVVAMPAAAESCWKGDGGKFCYALAYSGPAYQAGHGIYEWRVSHTERAVAPSLLKLRF